MREEFTNLV